MEEVVEKRKVPRVKTHIPVKYRTFGTSGKMMRASTITRDLSEGGVYFSAPQFISRACRLILELDIPMFSQPVKVISKVAWIRKTAMGDNYEVGNQFLEISKRDKELVSRYVTGLKLYNEQGNTETTL